MTATWIALAVIAGIGVLAFAIKYFRPTGHRTSADVDLGNVSEGWLSEQRARKD
jgi:hypothetical protein